ncbi:abortive infection family protein [Aminobacter anthyllidis]|uniref:abortive infection family protein n=1 Tax=Aminobacter anthyllidis TaxID=1035067 RepID=UPI00245693E1|nr:abortive infection family protein [Aminobacter anthyllidis]MDH4989105.1 abortive infection family protein [Aminobacter anthyllidis]
MEKSVTAALRAAVVDALYPISANILADVCEAFGLEPGTRDQAFSSKQRYVATRLLKLSREQVLEVAQRVLEEYPTEELAKAVRRAAQSQPADSMVSEALASFDEVGVHAVWQRAVARRETDPEGAITLARTLLEAVCKHIIDGSSATYNEKDELPRLYRIAAECLNLAPDQHTEDIFKRILGGCQTIVEGLGAIRNKLSDAHGRGPKPARATGRHAALAVNLAGAMAMFLVETTRERSG